MTNMKKIGPAVRELRKKAKMTLEELANEAGYDQGNLSKFERGLQTTDDSMVISLAAALNTSVGDLMRRAAEMDENEGNYPVTNAVTITHTSEPIAQYLEVKKVPVYEGVHLKALAEDQSLLSSIQITNTIPGPPDTRPRDFAMLATDDTMTSPPGSTQSYPVGHHVYFDPTLEHRSGDSVLVQIGGAAIAFTSIQNINGTWMMVPLNPRYPAKELPYNSKILAVAVGIFAITRKRL